MFITIRLQHVLDSEQVAVALNGLKVKIVKRNRDCKYNIDADSIIFRGKDSLAK